MERTPTSGVSIFGRSSTRPGPWGPCRRYCGRQGPDHLQPSNLWQL